MNFPENLKYTQDHEWAKVEGKIVTIGITDHAQNALGDVVFVELPEVGHEFNANDPFGVVESIKAVSDLMSPIQGKVIEVNETLNNEPNLINQNPYDNGWIVKIEMKAPDSAKELMSVSEYTKYVDSLN